MKYFFIPLRLRPILFWLSLCLLISTTVHFNQVNSLSSLSYHFLTPNSSWQGILNYYLNHLSRLWQNWQPLRLLHLSLNQSLNSFCCQRSKQHQYLYLRFQLVGSFRTMSFWFAFYKVSCRLITWHLQPPY